MSTFMTSFTTVRSNTTTSTTELSRAGPTIGASFSAATPSIPLPTNVGQPPGRGVSDLTTAGKAGIGVGVGVAGTIVISSFIYQNKKRRGRQQLQQQKSEMVSNPLTVRREGKRSDGIL